VYRDVVAAIVGNQGIELIDVPYDDERGITDVEQLDSVSGEAFAALVVPQPNYFGRLEPVHALTDWAHEKGGLVIGLVNPTSLALLAAPGSWGECGADIAVGEGQPLGLPLAGGGPYFGFMTCRAAHVRQMPGRIVGRTVDAEGRPGFTLTLQAREQHIRRSKATSNICTNQGLAAAAAAVYMALLGAHGLKGVATACHANLNALLDRLGAVGVRPRFAGPHFHEAVVSLDGRPVDLLKAMRSRRILGGVDISGQYAALPGGVLVCATETKSEQDLDDYAHALEDALTAGVLAG
jgi:glycine dehydrogenase subunit 1